MMLRPQLSNATCLCRAFNADEEALFEESAQYAYRSFRDKAAASRNMSVDDMQVSAREIGAGWVCWLTHTQAEHAYIKSSNGYQHEALQRCSCQPLPLHYSCTTVALQSCCCRWLVHHL